MAAKRRVVCVDREIAARQSANSDREVRQSGELANLNRRTPDMSGRNFSHCECFRANQILWLANSGIAQAPRAEIHFRWIFAGFCVSGLWTEKIAEASPEGVAWITRGREWRA